MFKILRLEKRLLFYKRCAGVESNSLKPFMGLIYTILGSLQKSIGNLAFWYLFKA